MLGSVEGARGNRRPYSNITIRLRLELNQLTPALSIQRSLYWHEHPSVNT
jgi:hypothetical protein